MKPLDSNFFDKIWQDERKKSSLYSRQQEPAAWNQFWDQYAPTYLKAANALVPENKKMIQKWKEMGLIEHSTRVLDIGCGPGTFALPLGEEAGEVVALDLSKKMLEILAGEARSKNINNIQVRQENWEDVNYAQEFDIVLAANSPAIYDFKTLMKMNQASQKYCLYICYAGKMHSTLRDMLWKEIMGEKMRGKAFDICYPFNILYQEGFLTNLFFEEQTYSYLEATDVVIENYRTYFKIFGRGGPYVDNLLKNCILKHDLKGYIKETFSYKLAVMWWDVRCKHI
ncbi:MAG: class I SAM-dependent methyltransferase [Bacillota bacterium]